MSSIAVLAANTVRPPQLAGDHAVQQIATSTTANSTALVTPKGKFYVTFQALTADCYVAFKNTNSAASVTTTTGFDIPAGTSAQFWIESNRISYIETVTASGTGTLKYYVSSQVYEKPTLL